MNSKHNVEDETAMTKAEKDDMKKSNVPLTSPPTTSPKEHPTMAVYVAVTLQPDKKTLEPSKSEAKQETSPPVQEPSSPKDSTDDKKGRSKEEPRDKVVNVVQMLIPTSPPPTPPVTTDDKNLPPTDVPSKVPSKAPSKAPPNQVNVTATQIHFDEEDKYVKNILDGMEELSCGTLTDDERTPAAAKTPPVFHKPEEVYSVEFVASSGQAADTFRQAQNLVAKEAFAKVTEKSPSDGQWLKELMAEAKPLLIRSLMHSQMLKPLVRTATIRLPERDIPIKAPPASVLAQQLMNSLITEVFDPAKMLEMHVAVRLPFYQTQSKEGPNYSVGIATTVKASEICSPVSCPDKVVCKSDTGKMAKTVYPTVLGGRPMLVDERFVDVIYRHMHMQENWETWSGQTGDRTPNAAPSIESYPPTPPAVRSPPPEEKKSYRKSDKTLTSGKTSTTPSTTSTRSTTSKTPSTTSTTRSTSSTLTPSTSSSLTPSTSQSSTSGKTSTSSTTRSSTRTTTTTQSPITLPKPDRPSSVALEKGRPPSEQIEEEMQPEGLEDVLRNYFEDSVDFEHGTGVSKGIRTPPGGPSERSPQLSIITVHTPDEPRSLATSPELSECGLIRDEERRRTIAPASQEERESDLYYYGLISNMFEQLPMSHTHGGWNCASCGFKKENGKPDVQIKRKKSSRNRRRT